MRKCNIEGCENKHLSGGMCNRHYLHMKRHGRILDDTKHQPNNIIECDDFAKIVLTDRFHNVVGVSLIDLEDVGRCREYRWHFHGKRYAGSVEAGLLHRFIMGAPPDVEVDHIGSTLDNRKAMLRLATHSNNSKYQRLSVSNTSGFKGAYWSTRRNVWIAQITVDYKLKYLGSFPTVEEAAAAYDAAAEEYFGEFSLTNRMLRKRG